MGFETLKELVPIVESIATTVAIFLGGLWTYVLFVKRRQRFPKASVEHAFEQIGLPDGKTLVHVAATISNEGEVLVSIESARTRIQQVLPLPEHIFSAVKSGKDPVLEGEHEVPWPVLRAREWQFSSGEAEIEPGEREVLHSDFAIDASVNTVVVYTYVKNHAKRRREIGWSQTTTLELNPRSPEES